MTKILTEDKIGSHITVIVFILKYVKILLSEKYLYLY